MTPANFGKESRRRDGKGDLAAMNNMRWSDTGVPSPSAEPTASAADLAVDLDQFRALYFESLPHVYGYLLHRVAGNAVLAEDLTQETYLAAVRALPQRGTLAVPWLIGVARHKLVDHFRRQAREERKLALVAQESTEDRPWRWSDMAADQVLASLHALPALQRAAVGLRYLDDLPVPEVARLLDRSVPATESLLARGRDGLRRHYLEHAGD
jgi:RNA polymerase sigma-70 factor (ECF subfamily)